jgi:penicillin-binding protein 1A
MEIYLKDKPDIPFRIPKGIKLVKIDADSGEPTDAPISKNVIYEAFKTGSSPATYVETDSHKDDDIYLAPSNNEYEISPDQPTGVINNLPTVGTGGMY